MKYSIFHIALCVFLVIDGGIIQASKVPQMYKGYRIGGPKVSPEDVDKQASQLITSIKDRLFPYMGKLQKAGYTLEAIPYIIRHVVETLLHNASINVVIALVNTLGKSHEEQWDPLVDQTMKFLLNKRFISYFGLAQRFVAWLGIKNLKTQQAVLIAEIFSLDTTLYPILLKQLEVRNRHEKEPCTFADLWIMSSEEFLKLWDWRFEGLISKDSKTLIIDGAQDSLIKQLTSFVGLRLIDKNIANKVGRITIQKTAIDTIIENELNHFPNLSRLELDSNKISNIQPNSFQGLSKLNWIDLGDNPISTQILEKLHIQLPGVTIDARHKIWWLFNGTWTWDDRIWLSPKDAAEFGDWKQRR